MTFSLRYFRLSGQRDVCFVCDRGLSRAIFFLFPFGWNNNMTKSCPKCNQANPADAAFCLNCASPLQPAAPYIGQQQAQQQWPGGANVGGQISHSSPSSASPSQKGMVAMILAIVAFLCCGPFTGIPAAILGWMELDAIKAGRTSPNSKVMAQVGLWGGIAATIIHGGLYILWVLLSAMSAASGPYYY